jgi:type I restriction enzyme S subunit
MSTEVREPSAKYLVEAPYKHTAIGEIPSDWSITSLREATDAARPISYGIVQTGPNIAGGVPCIRVVDIDNGSLNTTGLICTTEAISAGYRRTLLQSGDLVMPLRGKVGDVAEVGPELKGANLTRGVALLSIRSGIDGSYCRQALAWSSTRRRLEQTMNGSALQEIPIAALRSFQIALPREEREQRAIAAALSEVDALIAGLEKLIAKKLDIKQAAMQQLLTGQTRLSGFSGEWVVKRLGEICEISMGRTPSRLNPAFWGAGHVWLSIADLHGKVLSSSKEQITPLAASSMHVIPEGTLLMSFKLSIGRLCFAGCDLYTNEAICGFNNLLANSDYLYYALSRTDFSLYGKQAVKGYTLNKKSLALVEVALPSDKEQAAIANVLSAMDEEMADLERRLSKTRDLKQGMMQELLTGRTRLV